MNSGAKFAFFSSYLCAETFGQKRMKLFQTSTEYPIYTFDTKVPTHYHGSSYKISF